MVQIIENHIPNCTIIKISKQIEVSFDMDRIVYMENLNLKEQGTKNNLINLSMSIIGKLLRDSNIDGYLYSNMASVSPRKYKSRATMIGYNWSYYNNISTIYQQTMIHQQLIIIMNTLHLGKINHLTTTFYCSHSTLSYALSTVSQPHFATPPPQKSNF